MFFRAHAPPTTQTIPGEVRREGGSHCEGNNGGHLQAPSRRQHARAEEGRDNGQGDAGLIPQHPGEKKPVHVLRRHVQSLSPIFPILPIPAASFRLNAAIFPRFAPLIIEASRVGHTPSDSARLSDVVMRARAYAWMHRRIPLDPNKKDDRWEQSTAPASIG